MAARDAAAAGELPGGDADAEAAADRAGSSETQAIDARSANGSPPTHVGDASGDSGAALDEPGLRHLTPDVAALGAPLELQSTLDLLDRVREGDEGARDIVFRRCVKGLRRFAAGRLPLRCRGMNDTEDLVQDTVANALRRLGRFEVRHEGALLAYLRQAVLNRIIDEVRKKNRRPVSVSLPEDHADGAMSPLERVIGLQNVERYETALRQLRPRDQETIVMRLEQQTGYEAMAEHLGMPTSNAARVAVKRALFRLAEKMAQVGYGPAHGSSGGPATPHGSRGLDPETTP